MRGVGRGKKRNGDQAVRDHAAGYAGGSGPLGVVLCHGFTGSPYSLRGFAEHLTGAGFQVHLPLLPGHGTSWRDLNRTRWQDWYATVDRAYAALRRECDTVFVAGLSMGGGLALRLAEEHGAGVRGVVLVNPSLTTADKRFLALPVLSRILPSLNGITDDIAKPGVTEHGYDRVPLRALVSMTELWATVQRDLAKVDQPILLFRSATDHVVDPTSARLLLQQVGSAEVTERVLDRSFHVATLDYEANDIFAESVEFFRRLAAADDAPRTEEDHA